MRLAFYSQLEKREEKCEKVKDEIGKYFNIPITHPSKNFLCLLIATFIYFILLVQIDL